MANVWYTSYKTFLLMGGSLDFRSAPLKWALVDASQYTPSTGAGGHAFLSDIPFAARLLTSSPLENVTVSAAGVVDADDTPLEDPGTGKVGEYLVLFNDTGDEITSRLILFVDTAPGLPLSLDGTSDFVEHDAGGFCFL